MGELSGLCLPALVCIVLGVNVGGFALHGAELLVPRALSLSLSLSLARSLTLSLSHTHTHTCTEVLLDVAPGALGLTQMFNEMGETMSVVPLTARLHMLLDLSSDASALLTGRPFGLKGEDADAGAHGCRLDDDAGEVAFVTSLARRLFEIEMQLFPHSLSREWTQEKRNAFRRRLACVKTSSRMALLLHQFAASALESFGMLDAAQCEKPAADVKASKSNSKLKHYLPVVGDEVVYIRTGV